MGAEPNHLSAAQSPVSLYDPFMQPSPSLNNPVHMDICVLFVALVLL